MKKTAAALLALLLLFASLCPALAETLTITQDGTAYYTTAIMKLSLRSEPTNRSEGLGTYDITGDSVLLTGRHWDSVNSIWWVLCNFDWRGSTISGWTGEKRVDMTYIDVYDLPEWDYVSESARSSGEELVMTASGCMYRVDVLLPFDLYGLPAVYDTCGDRYSCGIGEVTLRGHYRDNYGCDWVLVDIDYGDYQTGWSYTDPFDTEWFDLDDLPQYDYISTSYTPDDSYDDPWDSRYCSSSVSALAIMKLSLRAEGTNRSEDLGTYNLEGQYVTLTARHWDSTNSIWWLKVEFDYRGSTVTGWTGAKRFDSSTYDINMLPEE